MTPPKWENDTRLASASTLQSHHRGFLELSSTHTARASDADHARPLVGRSGVGGFFDLCSIGGWILGTKTWTLAGVSGILDDFWESSCAPRNPWVLLFLNAPLSVLPGFAPQNTLVWQREHWTTTVISLNVGLYFLTLAQPKRCLHRLCRFSGRLRRFVRRLLGGWKSEMGLSALIGSPPAKSLQVNSMIALHLLTCWEFSWSFGDFLTNYNSSSSKCKFRTYLPK